MKGKSNTHTQKTNKKRGKT